MKILAVYDSSGPKYHRILTPSHGLEKYFAAEIKVVSHLPSHDPEDLFNGVDILFFNRAIAGANKERLLEWGDKFGFKMICDLDDHWILDKGHILHRQYQDHMISAVIEFYIRNSDAIIVTHDRLADEVYPLNANVHIIPNALPKDAQFLTKKKPDDCCRLFWAGGVTHKRDLELLREPLKKIKRDRVKFVMGGYEDSPEWFQMAKIFTTNSSYNTVVLRSLPPSQYYNLYSMCDISLIPLLENDFNIYKSNLKILEAANIEAPVVVSKVHPYLDFPSHLVNYVDLRHTWYAEIMKLIRDPQLRKEQGIELSNYCDKHYNFEKFTDQRNKIFNDTIKQSNSGKLSTEVANMDQ